MGLSALRAFHLNDSKTALGSRVDRHQEIGDGTMGLLPFWRLVNDRPLRRVARHPRDALGAGQAALFARNLQRLRALIGAPRPVSPPRPPTATGRTRGKTAPGQGTLALE